MLRYRKWTPLAAVLGAVACSSDSGGGGGTTKPPPEIIDVVADTNRDGVVNAEDPTDQDREDQFDTTAGSSFIANLDDDDGDQKRDADDEIVNGDADKLDLAEFRVTAWPTSPKDGLGVVRIDQEAAESVRIFKQNPDGSTVLVLGSTGACTSASDCKYVLEHKLTLAETQAGVTFLIEARRFRGMWLASLSPGDDAKKNTWTGNVDISYSIERETGERYTTKDVPDGFDHVKMRVAPWVMMGSLNPHDTIWSSEAVPDFVDGNTTAAQAASVGYTPYASSMSQDGGWQDIWTEDFFQTGWTGFPGPNGSVRGMRIFNSRPWGRPPQNATPQTVSDYLPIRWILGNTDKGRPPAVLGPDRGGAEFYDNDQRQSGNTQDSHGNHDLVPPFPGYNMGRIIHGNKVMKTTQEFYATQGVQGPPIVLDTTWLAVEHVDEFFHWVPAKTKLGWKLLVASPALMTKMLEDMKSKGNGSAVLHLGRGGEFEKTVDECLADTQLMQWSQVADAKIQGHIEVMKTETGLTDGDIIELPTWFEDLGKDEKVAWNPGMVNMRMMGNVADIPKPFGPDIGGSDPFEADVLARLGTPASELGSDGQGLKIFFTDDWYYHAALGEVHCGTNASSPAPFAANKWWESGK
ncbi:MAG: protein-arginine deiminase family protein [Polyangiaceae bacterium]